MVRQIMRKGKKSLHIELCMKVSSKLRILHKKIHCCTLEQAVRNATPLLEVKARRIGGSTYQVPLEVLPERGTALAIRWVLAACQKSCWKINGD